MDERPPADFEPEIEPRFPDSNPNISSTPPLREFATVGGIVLGAVLILYWGLGLLAGWLAVRVPDSVEAQWGQVVELAFESTAEDSLSEDQRVARDRMQSIVDTMARELPDRDFPYVVSLVDSPVVNAAALPGGHILVFDGLLREVESENELAMILGHELGHHVRRHHLKTLGRRLVIAFLSSVVLGSDGLTRGLLSGSLETYDQQHSREDEIEADEVGLELLHAVYGHVGGAFDFFERHAGDEGLSFLVFFRTHPLSRDRVEWLESRTAERGYAMRPTIPLEFPPRE